MRIEIGTVATALLTPLMAVGFVGLPAQPADTATATTTATTTTSTNNARSTAAVAGNPVDMTSGFYVDPNSNPATWARNNSADGRASKIRTAIANAPIARWFGGWSGDIRTATQQYTSSADAADKLPVLVAYNIPGRDCNGHSGGGAGSPAAYRSWISAFAEGIGTRPAIVVVEPDALAQLDCMANDADRRARVDLLKYAAEQLRTKAPNTWTYMDGGNASWIPAATMAQRLNDVGVAGIRGFAINVSNYHTTAASNTYGNQVNAALSSKFGYTSRFTVDTSRNGNGSNGEWCNPAGRKLGARAQVGGGAEMLLWIKVPGDSDGNCGIAPNTPAGTFSPDLAVRLIDGR